MSRPSVYSSNRHVVQKTNDPLPVPAPIVGVELAMLLLSKNTPIEAARRAVSETGYTAAINRAQRLPQLCVARNPRDKIIGRGCNQDTICIPWK